MVNSVRKMVPKFVWRKKKAGGAPFFLLYLSILRGKRRGSNGDKIKERGGDYNTRNNTKSDEVFLSFL